MRTSPTSQPSSKHVDHTHLLAGTLFHPRKEVTQPTAHRFGWQSLSTRPGRTLSFLARGSACANRTHTTLLFNQTDPNQTFTHLRARVSPRQSPDMHLGNHRFVISQAVKSPPAWSSSLFGNEWELPSLGPPLLPNKSVLLRTRRIPNPRVDLAASVVLALTVAANAGP